jgi:hypothetical protein
MARLGDDWVDAGHGTRLPAPWRVDMAVEHDRHLAAVEPHRYELTPEPTTDPAEPVRGQTIAWSALDNPEQALRRGAIDTLD